MSASVEILEKAPIVVADEVIPLKGDIESQSEKIEDVAGEIPSSESANVADSKESTPPAKKKKTKRIHALDNLRAFLIFLLILQHATLETVAHIPGFSDENYPKQSLFLTLFVTLTRHNVVGLLFFVSGLSSVYSMVVHKRGRTPLLFAFAKAFQTAIYVAGYYYAMQILQRVYGPWPQDDGKVVSFFALRQGSSWVLTGPIAYVFLLLVFDLTYVIARSINMRYQVYTRFVTTKVRYNVAKYTALAVLQFWTTFVATGVLRPPTVIVSYLSILNPISPFPVQYLLAYLAGLHFVSIYKFLLVETPPRFSIIVVSVRLFLVSSTLFAMYRRFSVPMHELSNLTAAPRYTISNPNGPFFDPYPGLFYGAWSTLSFFILPVSVIQLFFTNTYLKKDWGVISKVAFSLPFIHMFFIMELVRKTAWIPDHQIILKCIFVGLASATGGWLVAIARHSFSRWLRQTIFMKVYVAFLVVLVVLLGIVIGFFLLVAKLLGLPTPEWFGRARNAGKAALPEQSTTNEPTEASASPVPRPVV